MNYSGAKVYIPLLLSLLILFTGHATSGVAEEISAPLLEKRVDVQKGRVAFVEVMAEGPITLNILYPTQYRRYKESGSIEGGLIFEDITWLLYPVAAMLEDQTVYLVSEGEARFDVRYENIQERIDQLLKGEVKLRAGMEVIVEGGVGVIRLTPLIPDLDVMVDFSRDVPFVIVKTVDLARYRKGLKSFDQLYEEATLKGSEKGIRFSTTDFEDLYLLVKSDSPVRVKATIRATKESAESGC